MHYFAILTLLPAVLSAAVVKRTTFVGEVNSGIAHRAGRNPGTPPGGACAVPRPFFTPGDLGNVTVIVRVGQDVRDWDNSEICGVCAEVCNPNLTPEGARRCVNAIVLEQQGGLGLGDIALPDDVYESALGFTGQRPPVTWTTTKCGFTRPIRYQFDSSTNNGFLKLRVFESNLPVARVEIQRTTNGPWITLTRPAFSDNAFVPATILEGSIVGTRINIRVIPRDNTAAPIVDTGVLVVPGALVNSAQSNF